MTRTGSVERLARAVTVPGFNGTTTPDWLARRIDEGLGGVCWFGHNVPDVETARALSDDLHARRPDIVVLCDEEAGGVSRLEDRTGSSWPGAAALGRLDDVAATRDVAAAVGRLARKAGIDVVLAPVVDVNSDPDNPVIGVRSFGSEPELVGKHAAAFVDGLQSSGVAACAKHYPGHGATRTDSHLDLPYVDDPEAVLRTRDIAPFAAVVEAGVRTVMTAHVVFPAMDDQPATTSARLLGLLRDELGFGGVIVSDALDMHAISRRVGRGPGGVQAMAAGVDLLCIGNPGFPAAYDAETVCDEVVDAIVRAVEDRSLTEERLADAAARVTALSQWLDERPEAFGEADDDERFGLDVARRTISVRGDVRLRRTPFVVDVAGPVSIAAGHRHAHLLDALVADAPGAEVCTLPSGAPESHVDEVLAAAGDRDVVIVVSSRLDPATVANVRTLVAAAPDAVVVSAGSAVEIDATGRGAVDTFGGGRATAVAVAEALGVAVLDDDPNGPPATADGLDHTDSRQRGLA